MTCVGHHIAHGLRHVGAHVLPLLLALLDELCGAGLALPLHPLQGLEGGHVHTELLVMEVNWRVISINETYSFRYFDREKSIGWMP